VSSAGLTCAAHFDTFSNTHALLLGRKRVRLVPPAEVFALETRPGTHPSARQARRSLADEAAAFLSNMRVVEAEIVKDEAIYIPPCWVHEFEALAPSVALSLTSSSAEWRDFSSWATADRRSLLPFMDASHWPAERVAASLIVFVPALVMELELATDEAAASSFLRASFLRSYGAATRAEAGLHAPADTPPHCEPPGAEVAATARSAAREVAARFSSRYDREQWPIYLVLLLENVLTFDNRTRDRSGRLGLMIDFVEQCLAPPETAKEEL